MSQVFLSPSNPGASTQTARTAAAAANMTAIRNAAAAVNNTAAPLRVGPTGANQGIVRLGTGIWFIPMNTSIGATFTNVCIAVAPGATLWPADGTSGHMFLVQTPDNFSIIGAQWADTGSGAAVKTMANKTGSGWPVIAANLGGGDPDGPRITATGDPRVPWTIPIDEMFSFMGDKNHGAANYLNNHCGFMKINKAGVIEADRIFFFGYVNGTSSAAAMIVPAAPSQGTPLGSNSCRKLILSNQAMINAPQGFGLNQLTDVNTYTATNLYCVGGEALRMETHVSKDGGILNGGTFDRIAQAGGNVGVAFTAHDMHNGRITGSNVWSHSSYAGACKVRQGGTGKVGDFAAGSIVRGVIAIAGDNTWAQDQQAAPGNEGNTPAAPHYALQRDAPARWVNNVQFAAPLAFGHLGTASGVAIGQTPGTADGFAVQNATFGIAATTRDTLAGGTTDPGTNPPPTGQFADTTGRFAGQHLAHLHRDEGVFHRIPNAVEARRWASAHALLYGQWRSGEAGHNRAVLPANGLYTYNGTARAEPDMALGNPNAVFGVYMNGTLLEGETFGKNGGAPSGTAAFNPSPFINSWYHFAGTSTPSYFGNYEAVLTNTTNNVDLSAATTTPFGDTNPSYLKVVHANFRYWLPRWSRYMLEKHPAGPSLYTGLYYDLFALGANAENTVTNLVAHANALAAYLHPLGYHITLNSLQEGASYWASQTSTTGTKQMLASNADMHNAEFFLKGSTSDGDAFPDNTRWVADVSMAMDVQKQGKQFRGSCKIYDNGAISGYDPETSTPQWRNLFVASTLIANRGACWTELLPFGFSSQDDASPPGKKSYPDLTNPWQAAWRFWHEQPFYNPIYGVDLGAPIDPNEAAATADNTSTQASRYLRGGVYQRRFERGIAIVNVSGSTKSVDLDARTYTEVDGTAVTSPVSVANNTGRVLLTAAPPVESQDIPAATFPDTTITLAGGNRQAVSSAGTVSLTRPVGLADGDVLVAHLASDDATAGTPSGATRLYLRGTTANVGTQVATELSSSRAASASNNHAADLSVTRNPTAAAVTQTTNTVAGTALQKLYLGKWISPPLNVSSITSQTWNVALAGNEADLNANQQFGVSIYVLKSDTTVRGYVYDADVALGTELNTGTRGKVFTVAGTAVASVSSGSDKLAVEVWTRGTPAVSGTYPIRFRYDGNVDPANDVVETQPAPYIETPQTLFGVGGSHGSFTPPSGWTAVAHGTGTDADGDMQGATWYKVASNAAAEPATYSFGLPTTGGAIGALTAWRGVDVTALLSADESDGTGSDDTPTAGTVSTAADGGLAVIFVSAHTNGGITYPSSEWVEAYHEAASTEHQVSAAGLGIPTAGPSGSLDSTIDRAAAWQMTALAFDAAGTTPPVTSDLVLEVDEESANGRNRLFATALSDAAVTITITRKHPSGKVVTVRGIDRATMNAGTYLGYDYEAPVRWGVVYHATAYDAAGGIVGESVDVPSFWDTSDDWLTDPLRAERGFPVQIAAGGIPQEAYDGRVGVHQVLGRPTPVTISQTRSGATGTISIFTGSLDERDAMQLLLAAGGPLLLRTSPERGVRSLYLQPLTTRETRVGALGDQPERIWEIDYVEVGPPPGLATGSSVTWEDVEDTYATWSDLLDNVETWIDLIDGRTLSVGGSREILPWRGA